MEVITYQIETEVDLTRVTSLLDERQIPYTIKRNSDLFPYNGERRPIAEILVMREFEKQALAIFDKFEKRANVVPQEEHPDAEKKAGDQKKAKWQQYWKPVLIVYSLAATVLLIKYWDRGSSDTKNFIYAWSLSNTELTVRYKKSQHLIEIFTDENFDSNFEKTETYSKNHNAMTSLSQDFNEDGFNDDMTYFGKNGKISGSAVDSDSDGWIEESVMILENGDTLKLTDKNQDGFFMLEK